MPHRREVAVIYDSLPRIQEAAPFPRRSEAIFNGTYVATSGTPQLPQTTVVPRPSDLLSHQTEQPSAITFSSSERHPPVDGWLPLAARDIPYQAFPFFPFQARIPSSETLSHEILQQLPTAAYPADQLQTHVDGWSLRADLSNPYRSYTSSSVQAQPAYSHILSLESLRQSVSPFSSSHLQAHVEGGPPQAARSDSYQPYTSFPFQAQPPYFNAPSPERLQPSGTAFSSSHRQPRVDGGPPQDTDHGTCHPYSSFSYPAQPGPVDNNQSQWEAPRHESWEYDAPSYSSLPLESIPTTHVVNAPQTVALFDTNADFTTQIPNTISDPGQSYGFTHTDLHTGHIQEPDQGRRTPPTSTHFSEYANYPYARRFQAPSAQSALKGDPDAGLSAEGQSYQDVESRRRARNGPDNLVAQAPSVNAESEPEPAGSRRRNRSNRQGCANRRGKPCPMPRENFRGKNKNESWQRHFWHFHATEEEKRDCGFILQRPLCKWQTSKWYCDRVITHAKKKHAGDQRVLDIVSKEALARLKEQRFQTKDERKQMMDRRQGQQIRRFAPGGPPLTPPPPPPASMPQEAGPQPTSMAAEHGSANEEQYNVPELTATISTLSEPLTAMSRMDFAHYPAAPRLRAFPRTSTDLPQTGRTAAFSHLPEYDKEQPWQERETRGYTSQFPGNDNDEILINWSVATVSHDELKRTDFYQGISEGAQEPDLFGEGSHEEFADFDI